METEMKPQMDMKISDEYLKESENERKIQLHNNNTKNDMKGNDYKDVTAVFNCEIYETIWLADTVFWQPSDWKAFHKSAATSSGACVQAKFVHEKHRIEMKYVNIAAPIRKCCCNATNAKIRRNTSRSDEISYWRWRHKETQDLDKSVKWNERDSKAQNKMQESQTQEDEEEARKNCV